MTKFTINGKSIEFKGDPNTPLLWVIRDHLQLTGTKFGCGIGSCGACTVHVQGKAQRSCVTTVGTIKGQEIRTIEGLSDDGSHHVQKAWVAMDVPQCGYCQAGQIMAATDFLERFPNPTDADIDENMTNLCRCGTYVRIRKAIHLAAALKQESEVASS